MEQPSENVMKQTIQWGTTMSSLSYPKSVAQKISRAEDKCKELSKQIGTVIPIMFRTIGRRKLLALINEVSVVKIHEY